MEEASLLLNNKNQQFAAGDIPEQEQEAFWDDDPAELAALVDGPEVVRRGVGATATREALDPEESSLWGSEDVSGGLDSGDLVRIYLNKIAEHPLLNAEQEVELSKAIEAGLFAAQKLAQAEESGKALPSQLAADLARIAVAGERAKDTMINSNLRLVVSIAKRYRTSPSMSFLDFIQEGSAGLVHAVEKFDYTKGFKFSTYASWWIRQAITRARADHSRTVRIPVHQSEVLSTWKKTFNRLGGLLGRDPTDEEILAAKREETAARLRAKNGKEPTKAQIDKGTSLTLKNIQWAKEYSRMGLERPTSLDMQLSEDGSSTLLDVLADDSVEDPDEALLVQDRKELAWDLLDELRAENDGDRMARIVMERIKGKRLEDIGTELGISRERTRQLEKKGRDRLKIIADRWSYRDQR